jgi:hypothetical protein
MLSAIQKHEIILTRQAWQQGIIKKSFIIPWWQVSFFFLWQAALLEKPWLHLKWLHFRLTLIPLLISPKPLTVYNKIIVDIRSLLGPAKIHSVDLLDICWTCSYPISCTLTLWQKYVNLSKWLWYQNFYFRQKSQLILGQNFSSPPLKNKWSPHHVLTLHAMRNSKKSKWEKPQKTIIRHCNIQA